MLEKNYILPFSHSKGQGLLETIIALGIITTGLIALLALIVMGLSFSGQTKEKIIGLSLAREGIEILRAIRDSNQLDPTQSWPFGLEDGNWIVDFNNTTALDQEADNPDINQCLNCRLYLDSKDRYTHNSSGAAITVFRRMVKIEEQYPAAPHEIKIISLVSWQERNRIQSVILEDVLTDWR
jgi:hypothetical protein